MEAALINIGYSRGEADSIRRSKTPHAAALQVLADEQTTDGLVTRALRSSVSRGKQLLRAGHSSAR
jgi:hypothetical protein